MEKYVFRGLLLLLLISTVMWITEKNAIDNSYSEVGDSTQHSPTLNRYVIYDNGTVQDTETGLLWMHCSIGQTWNGSDCDGEPQAMTWEDAMKINIDFAGHENWQLPTVEELGTLTYCSSKKPKLYPDYQKESDFCRGNYRRPTINTTAFPVLKTYQGHEADEWFNLSYWSSTIYKPSMSSAWGINFHSGFTHDSLKSSTGYVRLVWKKP